MHSTSALPGRGGGLFSALRQLSSYDPNAISVLLYEVLIPPTATRALAEGVLGVIVGAVAEPLLPDIDGVGVSLSPVGEIVFSVAFDALSGLPSLLPTTTVLGTVPADSAPPSDRRDFMRYCEPHVHVCEML